MIDYSLYASGQVYILRVSGCHVSFFLCYETVLLLILFIRLRLAMYTVIIWLSRFILFWSRVASVLLMILFIRLRLVVYTVIVWLSRLIFLVSRVV